jgi:hypothetical protein
MVKNSSNSYTAQYRFRRHVSPVKVAFSQIFEPQPQPDENLRSFKWKKLFSSSSSAILHVHELTLERLWSRLLSPQSLRECCNHDSRIIAHRRHRCCRWWTQWWTLRCSITRAVVLISTNGPVHTWESKVCFARSVATPKKKILRHANKPDQSTANRSAAASKLDAPCAGEALSCTSAPQGSLASSELPVVPGKIVSNRRSRFGVKNCTKYKLGWKLKAIVQSNAHLQSTVACCERFWSHDTLQKFF